VARIFKMSNYVIVVKTDPNETFYVRTDLSHIINYHSHLVSDDLKLTVHSDFVKLDGKIVFDRFLGHERANMVINEYNISIDEYVDIPTNVKFAMERRVGFW